MGMGRVQIMKLSKRRSQAGFAPPPFNHLTV